MASAKNIELEADFSCDSIDAHYNAAGAHAEFHNSSYNSMDTWFTAAEPDSIDALKCNS